MYISQVNSKFQLSI